MLNNIKLLIVAAFWLCHTSPNTSASFYKPLENTSTTLNDAFQDGWRVGWKAGWRQVNGQYSFPTFPPFPPFPNFGEDNFQGGYNAGFLAGIAAAGGI